MTEQPLTRRHALTGVAALGVAVPILAACGSSDTPAATGSAGAGAPSTQASSGGASAASGSLAATSDVPVGGGVILSEDQLVLTQPTKGTFKAFTAICTHKACPLTSVASGTIDCTCHGSKFSITDGSNVQGPNGEPAGSVAALSEIAIKVSGGEITKA